MKNRNGFVSNSSSSSFIILKEDKTLSKEELIKKTKKIYDDAYGCDDHDATANKLAEEGKYVLLIQNIDYGAEEAAEKLAKKLCKIGNIESVSFQWDNY